MELIKSGWGAFQKTCNVDRTAHGCREDRKSETTRQQLLTKVELTVDLLTVDDVELIRNASLHVAHLEVEPLMMMVGVDVTVEYQVILILTHLHHRHQLTLTIIQ